MLHLPAISTTVLVGWKENKNLTVQNVSVIQILKAIRGIFVLYSPRHENIIMIAIDKFVIYCNMLGIVLSTFLYP